jgi:hypothetical protein
VHYHAGAYHYARANYARAHYCARAHHHAAYHYPYAAYHHPRATEPSYDATSYYHDATYNYDCAAHHHDGCWRTGARPCPAAARRWVSRRVPGGAGRRLLSVRDAAPQEGLFSGPWLIGQYKISERRIGLEPFANARVGEGREN